MKILVASVKPYQKLIRKTLPVRCLLVGVDYVLHGMIPTEMTRQAQEHCLHQQSSGYSDNTRAIREYLSARVFYLLEILNVFDVAMLVLNLLHFRIGDFFAIRMLRYKDRDVFVRFRDML